MTRPSHDRNAPVDLSLTLTLRSKLSRRLPKTGLWGNPSFLNLWTAESISQVGAQISPVAIPLLAALTLHATPFQMGLLAAASGFPVLLIGLIAGTWVDRLRRKPIMLAMDIGRAAVLLVIPAAALLDFLSMPVLLVVSLLTGAQSVIFNAAYVSILPSLVERRDLPDANSKLYASVSLAQVIGPATAGVLVSWITAPMVIVLNAITYLGSAEFIRRIGPEERSDTDMPERQSFLREAREGLGALFGSPVLRAISLSSATINLAGWMFLAVYILYMTDDLGLSPGGVGLVFASGGVGALIGSVIAPRLASRWGTGPTIVWSAVLFGVFGLTVPLAILIPEAALPLVVFAELMQWLTLVVFNILAVSLRQTLTPGRLLGRVAASSQVLSQGMMPIGSLLGGIVGSLFGVQAALLAGVAGMFVAAAWVIASPVRHIRQLDTVNVDLED